MKNGKEQFLNWSQENVVRMERPNSGKIIPRRKRWFVGVNVQRNHRSQSQIWDEKCHMKSKMENWCKSLYANARIFQAKMEDLKSKSIDTDLLEILWDGNNFEEKESFNFAEKKPAWLL